MQLKWKKIGVLSTIIVYCASFLIQSNFSFFEAWAKESNLPRVNIVAILVDSSIYPSISGGLSWYGSEYIQKRISDSKALIIPVDVSSNTAYDIYRMLENIYFDGLKDVNSSLVGLIMFGDIPLPVVNQDGYIFPTVYPYVDFENQKYVWDPETKYFVSNGNPEGQAEVWHGLVNYGGDPVAYSEFFEKIQKYDEKPEEFIGDSLWYEDLIASKAGFLNENYKYYRNKIMYGEDISYQRYSPLMKKLFADESSDDSSEIVEDLVGTMESLGGNVEDIFGDVDMEEAMGALKTSGQVPSTKMIQQEIETSLLADYNELFSKTDLSLMRENVFAGGRWIKTYENGSGEKSQIVDSDSSASMIQLKDTMYLGNENLQGLFENLNELMEKMIDEKIENEKYSMDIVVPISFKEVTGRRVIKCHQLVRRWENYYFGKNARYIDTAKEFSLYRGTYRNLDTLTGLTYDDLLTGNNPVKSELDKTDVKLKSIGASYDVFSSQAEGNRGFLMTAANDDIETFEANKESKKGSFSFKEIFNFSSVKRRTWKADCKEKDCEELSPFALRWRGGASPINLLTDSVGSGKYAISGYTAISSIRSQFDMGGFQSLLSGEDEGFNGKGWATGKGVGPQWAATSFRSYIKYSSPTEREGWTKKWWGYEIYENHTSDVHTDFSKLDYFNLLNSNPLAFRLGRFNADSNKIFTISYTNSTNKILSCASSWDYSYKVLSSVVKHDSTNEDEINGILYDKYGESGNLGSYYHDLYTVYDGLSGDMKEILDTFPGLISSITGTNELIQSKIDSLHGQGDSLSNAQTERGKMESSKASAEDGLKTAQSNYADAESDYEYYDDLVDSCWDEYNALGEDEDGSDLASECRGYEDSRDEASNDMSYRRGEISRLNGVIEGLDRDIEQKKNEESSIEKTISELLDEVSGRIAEEHKEIVKIYKLVEGLFPENINSVLEYIILAEGGSPEMYYEGYEGDTSGLVKVGFLGKWIENINSIHDSLLDNRKGITDSYNVMFSGISSQQVDWSKLADKLRGISKENLGNIDKVSGEMTAVLTVTPEREDNAQSSSSGEASLGGGDSEEGPDIEETPAEPVTLTGGTASISMNGFGQILSDAKTLFDKVIVVDTTGAEIAFEARTRAAISNKDYKKQTGKDNKFRLRLDKKGIDTSNFEEEDWIMQFAIWAYGDGQDDDWMKDINNQEKIHGVVIHMSGLNILTPDRPIDSPRYVSMQSIAGNEIKFIYPDLFKVEVFELTGKNKSGYDIHALLTGGQIKEKLIEYLSGKVEEYNTILEKEYNNALSSNAYYDKLLNSQNFKLATPTKNKEVRPYNLFTLDDFIDALGGTGMLDAIPEMLYYQSLTNKKKLSTGDVSEDISLIKKSFNINDKREQTLEDYLVEGNEEKKNPLFVIPTYELSGYEVAYVNSDGRDYIIPTEETEEIQGLSRQTNISVRKNENEQPKKEEDDLNDKCGIPDDGVLPIFAVKDLKVTSPWYDGFKCWLSHLKDSVKLEFKFYHSLGEVNIGSGFWEFVKSTDLGESATAWGDAMTKYADDWESLVSAKTGFNADMAITNEQVAAEKHNQEVLGGDSGAANALSSFSRYIKISNSNARLSDNNLYSDLKIGSVSDIGNISVSFQSTGDSCLALDGRSLCGGGISIPFNPKTNPFTGQISSLDHKAGSSALILKISLGGDYIEKIIKYSISPSLLDRAEIKVKDDKTIAGMISPVEVIGYDKYNNEVSWGLDRYDFTVSQGRFLKDGAYQESFTTNDFRDLKFYYQAPLDAVDGSMAIIQISKADGIVDNQVKTYLGTYQQPVAQAKPEVRLNNVTILRGDQLMTNQSYQLKNNEDIYVGGNLSVGKLQKLEVDMKDARGNIVDVDSQIVVTSQNGLVVVGQVQDEGTGGLRFMETSRNYMSGGHAVIYYYPTTVAGKDIINIDIPGLDTRIINLDILPGLLANVQISLEKDVLPLGEQMGVELFLSDVWGNLINYPEIVTLQFDEEKIQFVEFPLAEDFVDVPVSNGYRNLPIIGTGAGLTYIINGGKYAQLTVDKHIFPESGLNIMYLNYFGNDWGNQWGYFSDNIKHVETLMTQSHKLIATTTQLVSENKIKKMAWKIEPGFRIWNPDNLDTSMTFQGASYRMIVGGITEMMSTVPSFNPIQLTQDAVENVLNGGKASQNNVFFIPSDIRYTLSGGILYDSGVRVANILNSEVTLQLSRYTMSNGDNIWNVTNKGVNYGSLVMHYPTFRPKVDSFSLPGSRYSVNYTFTNGSTDKITTVGIFDMQSNFELDSSYKSIQDSNNADEQIGFLGDFKNITLFAQGETVGEATRKFGSEFVINLGDPVLSKKPTNENEKVYGTTYEGGIGNEIFVDPEKDIYGTYEIDFNNDGSKDLLAVYLDGTIKLSKSYGGDLDLRDMQELMRIAVPINEVYVGDADGNGYDDILILTKNNQIRAYLNHGGIFDVDGNVACLNLNVRGGEVSTTPSDISQVYQLFIEDMDVDGVTDIITYDHKGFVKIFYGGTTNGGPNYLSKEKYACDDGWYLRGRSNTKTITAYGLKVTSDRVFDNSMLHRRGMAKEEIEITEDELPEYGVTISTNEDYLKNLIKPRGKGEKGSIEQIVHEVMDKFDTSKAVEKFQDESIKYQEVTLYENTLVDGGNSKNYIFAPVSYLSDGCEEDIGIAWKNYSLKSGSSILQDGDIVTVVVTVKASAAGFNGAFGDVIQGPWRLYYDDDNIMKGIEFISNKRNAVVKKRDGNFAYLIDNITLAPGEIMQFKYDLEYVGTQLRNLSLSYETFWSPDELPDIKEQSIDGCSKDFGAFVNGGGRSFGYEVVPIQEMIENTYKEDEDYTKDFGQTVVENQGEINDLPGILGDKIERIKLIQDKNDFSAMEVANDEIGKDELKNAIMKKIEEEGLESLNINFNINLSIFEDETDKIEDIVDDITEGMCNGFQFGGSHNCKGLPVPFNQAFLAPGKYHLFGCRDLPLKFLEGGVPAFFFPGTMPGYPAVPIPWGLKAQGDDFLWAPGGNPIYNSLIRIYAAPTLTAQLGLAICIGPYATSHLFPSPLGDVAGNCVVFAIKPQCKDDGGDKQDPENPNETYEKFTEEVRDSGTCSLTQKGPTVTRDHERSSAYDLYSYSSTFSDLRLTNSDIEHLLMDLERKYPTKMGELTLEERKKYSNISKKVWDRNGKPGNGVDNLEVNYGSVWEKIWTEYQNSPEKMSVDMQALGINIVTLGLFRHVMGTEYVDSLYGSLALLYTEYFLKEKMVPATDLGYGYTEYSSSFMGIIEIETSAYMGRDELEDDTKNSITIGNVEIVGGKYDVNKIRGGFQQGLKELLIDKWLDPQIRYILNQLTKMHVLVKLPEMTNMVQNEISVINNVSSSFGELWSGFGQISPTYEEIQKPIRNSDKVDGGKSQSTWNHVSRETLNDLNKSLANPFEGLASLMNQSNIMNISTRKMTVKVPYIFGEDISAYTIYLQEWIDVNKGILEEWQNALNSLYGSCAKIGDETEKQECYAKAGAYLDSLDEFRRNEWQKMLDQIYTNILILQEYRDFPFEIYEWIHVIDRYMGEITSLVNNTFGYLSYWLNINANRFVGYVDAIVLALNIIATYQLIIDFSVNWSKNCGNCANDTYDQYSCKLSFLCKSIELPILQIPNFKIPNITLDLTNINLGLDIVLPEFNFQPIQVELPDLINLPEPPRLGANIKLLDLPDIPQLPEPPDLPDLPSFIPDVEIELPILPPAPEIPRLPNKIEGIIKFANIVGKIYCIVKGSFGFVGEKSVKSKIEQITQRTYKVDWIDNIMDFTNWSAAPVKNYGVDYEISSYVDMQFNFSDFYDYLDVLTTSINNLTTSVVNGAQDLQNSVVSTVNEGVSDILNPIDSRDIQINATLLDLDKKNGDNGIIKVGYNNSPEFNGVTSDEIEYVDYGSAKSRLEEVLAYFRTEANNTSFKDTINSSISKIENDVNSESSIKPNDEGIEKIKAEALSYVSEYQSGYEALANMINNDYDGFLAMVNNHNLSNDSSDSEKLLTFNVNLYDLDSSTKESLTNIKNANPYEMLLDNKHEVVDGYWKAINSNTADSLGLTQSQYLALRDNISNMRQQVATLYSVVRPVSSTQLVAKNGGNVSSDKTLVAGLRMGSNMETSVQVDPSAFSRGIYEMMTEGADAGERLAKVVYADSFASLIRNRYFHTTHSVGHDIILWTENAVFKKCSGGSCTRAGNHYGGSYHCSSVNNKVPYVETWISCGGAGSLKIADGNEEVKNWNVKGQTYDNLSFGWTLNNKVDGYLIKLVERIDHSYEKADFTQNLSSVRYVLALPKGTDLAKLYEDKVKLELIKKTDLIEKLLGKDLVEIVYYDNAKALADIVIGNIDRKWYYARISTLDFVGDTYSINSPWSNQIVAGKQAVGDEQPPLAKQNLYRPAVDEIVSEGDDLEGFVGTKYELNIEWSDNVALSYISISQSGVVLDEKYTSKPVDTLKVDIDMHFKSEQESYNLLGIDQFGNKTEKTITVTYSIPEITITDIKDNGDDTVAIIAELSQDIDQGNVSFQRRRGNLWRTMKKKDVECADMSIGAGEQTVIGTPYSKGTDIAMYDKGGEVMALMNPDTAEINILSGYDLSYDVKVFVQNSSILQVYNTGTNEIMFSISIPTEKCLKVEADNYNVVDLPEVGKMGMFNGGKAVYKDGTIVLLISPTGHLYSEYGLEGSYDYDREIGAVELTLFELSDLGKSHPIKVWLKVEPFLGN